MLAAVLAACAGAPSSPAAAAPVAPTANIEIERYLGRWYIIANIPNRAENGRVRSYVEYGRTAGGAVSSDYVSAQDFVAPLEKPVADTPAWLSGPTPRWPIRFNWAVSRDYQVLYVDPEYRYAVAGHPSRDYVWILAREPRVPDDRYAQLLELLDAQGYDSSRVLKVPQISDQEGAPGFQ